MTTLLLKASVTSLAMAARIARRLERQRHEAAWQSRQFAERIATNLEGYIISQESADLEAASRDVERSVLHRHRTHTVRKAARAAHLAYGFLRGTDYVAMENKCWSPPDWLQVQALIENTVPRDEMQGIVQKFSEWRDAAGVWKQPDPKPARPRPNDWVKRQVTTWGPPEDSYDAMVGWRRRA